ncbi:MAG: MAE_28990/MAE_18760 family HEPN-like nuclease [Desulfococcaceae bacterium]|jgi:hypothetical protein|nr:MAE_28990/MAE_18760 family HEPN-like nuclease [Desulfococcaceae bacterium]
MKPVSLEKFLDQLDNELAWREKEIDLLKKRISESDLDTDLRAGVVLLYAHWEGFVKSVINKYIKFVASKRLRLDELDDCFIALALKKECRELQESKKTAVYIKAVEFMLNRLSEQANIPYEKGDKKENKNLDEKEKVDEKEIKTSNLKFKVLKEFLLTIGLTWPSDELNEKRIDFLVNTRNDIAHGKQKYIDKNTLTDLFTEITRMIRNIQTDIFDAAEQKSYKRRAI